MKEEGIFIKLSKKQYNILVCIREKGKERHFSYPLTDLYRWEHSFFRMKPEK